MSWSLLALFLALSFVACLTLLCRGEGEPEARHEGGKEVYVSGKKVEIQEAQQFEVTIWGGPGCECEWCRWYVNEPPYCIHPPHRWQPLVDVYVDVVLEGLLLRGVTTSSSGSRWKRTPTWKLSETKLRELSSKDGNLVFWAEQRKKIRKLMEGKA